MAKKPTDFAKLTEQGSAGRAKQWIAGKVVAYDNAAIGMHHSACIAIYHAAQYGNPYLLTYLYHRLSDNNKFALKVWANKIATYQEDGSDKRWLSFDSATKADEKFPAGMFKTPSGKAEHRIDAYTIGELLDGPSFLAVDNVATVKVMTEASIIAALVRMLEGTETKADNKDVKLSAATKSAIKAAAKELKAVQAVVAPTPAATSNVLN